MSEPWAKHLNNSLLMARMTLAKASIKAVEEGAPKCISDRLYDILCIMTEIQRTCREKSDEHGYSQEG